jgi:hypothetical protein
MSQLIGVPQPRFPNSLDDNNTLFEVFNTSESELSQNFTVEDDTLFIKPRSFSESEKWSKESGVLNLEGELIYYSGVITEDNPNPSPSNNPNFSFFDDPSISDEEKNEQRRVTAFTNMIRGLGSVNPRIHLSGEIVRGYVLAEHHNALLQSMLGVEELIGTDNSTDHLSLDFRLRDLEELIVERDDLDCPFGVFWFEIIDSNAQQDTVQFHITIIGSFDRFEFIPEDEAEAVTDDLNPIFTYGTGVDIEATLKVFKGTKCCFIVTSSGIIADPCEFAAAIPDIPEIICPEIDVLEPPVIPIDVECTCTTDTCTITECPVCTDCVECTDCEILTPITFTIPEIPTQIALTFNTDINITAPTIDVSVNVNVSFARDDTGEDINGACFRIVPCLGTIS